MFKSFSRHLMSLSSRSKTVKSFNCRLRLRETSQSSKEQILDQRVRRGLLDLRERLELMVLQEQQAQTDLQVFRETQAQQERQARMALMVQRAQQDLTVPQDQ